MGIVNVTPDSFSDGGDLATPAAAIARGRSMLAEGADLLDIGGESTRPGSDPVAPEEELRRVLPVVEGLAAAGACVSIDTRNAATMRRAIAAGARLVNDVSALAHDPGALDVVAESGVPVVLMHAQGDPRTMQRDPAYAFAPLDVFDYLEARIAVCLARGIGRERIVVDPGIGFGKTLAHNLEILNRLALLHGLGCPILLGASRKSFIGRLSRGEPPKARGPGSLAAALAGIERGAAIVRVHDVAETAQALAVARAIGRGMP
jgi:dihydropteroate synthase